MSVGEAGSRMISGDGWGPLPPYLYKFRSLAGDTFERTRDIVLNNRLYWPTPNELNDPFDCSPSAALVGSKLKIEVFVRGIVRSAMPYATKAERRQAVVEALRKPTDEIEVQMMAVHQQWREQMGILSLTARFDHPLMWSHYSDSHRGVCLRFRTHDPSLYFAQAMPVIYSPERPIIDIIERKKLDLVEMIIRRKADVWSYEEEWRLLDQNRSGLHDLPPMSLSAIILGAGISPVHHAEVVGWVKGRSEVALIRAQLDKRHFQLNFDEMEKGGAEAPPSL